MTEKEPKITEHRYRQLSYGDISHPNAQACLDCGTYVVDVALHEKFHKNLKK